jgi:hypothetical protein
MLEILFGWMFKPSYGYTFRDWVVLTVEHLIVIFIIYSLVLIAIGIKAMFDQKGD